LLYYLSRYQRKTQTVIITYAILSYVTLIANYFFNSGIDGPTLLVFFVIYNLLIAITSPRLYILWVALHTASVCFLLWYEYNNPAGIPGVYANREERFIDIFGTYLISLGFISIVTGYLRISYVKEQRKAVAHARRIEVQSRKISMQNTNLKTIIQERDKLFSIISHDMLGPLSSIQSYLELVTENPELDEMEMKQELLNLTKNTSGMLRNILQWSKSQAQGVQLHKTRTNINDVITQILNVQRSIAATKGIDIVTNTEDELYTITDPEILKLVVRNLVNNAVKFTPQGGIITVSIGQEDNGCLVSVQDTGIGMTEEQQQKLFTSEVKSTYGTSNEKGVGLGLSLSNEFVKLLGGKIMVQSKPNEGSVFSVYLPAA
ncbi:MAG: HAMP domain-containing histidine kinase, partial [Taibaiella sp.]|nr:HAMP domain-containing histidine kinase [Taibaiella sp.]